MMKFVDPWDNEVSPSDTISELHQCAIDSGNIPTGIPDEMVEIVCRMWINQALRGDAEKQVLIEEISAIRSVS